MRKTFGGGVLLVKANMEASEEDRLPDSELTAQMSYVLFSSSLLLQYTLIMIIKQ